MSYVLTARCTDEQTRLHIERLEAMYDCDREISAATFFRHVSMREVAELLGYAYGRGQKGVRLMKDPTLRFYRSQWRGTPCFHLDWSAIDHVFVKPEHLTQMQ